MGPRQIKERLGEGEEGNASKPCSLEELVRGRTKASDWLVLKIFDGHLSIIHQLRLSACSVLIYISGLKEFSCAFRNVILD